MISMKRLRLGRLEIIFQLHPKKDPDALEKLFALCDRLPQKFKTQEEFIKWCEQG